MSKEKSIGQRITDGLCRWIPRLKKEGLILGGFQLLSKIKRVPAAVLREHKTHNENVWAYRREELLQISADGKLYIEHQEQLGKMSGKKPLCFGLRRRNESLCADYNACEAIAVYNLEHSFGMITEDAFPDVLSEMEATGAAWGGLFGSTPTAVLHKLQRDGLHCGKLPGSKCTSQNITQLCEQYDAFIVVAFNDRQTLKAGIHTMCVTKYQEAGIPGYLIHNDYDTYGKKRYPTLEAAIHAYRNGHAKILLIIGVKKAGFHLGYE